MECEIELVEVINRFVDTVEKILAAGKDTPNTVIEDLVSLSHRLTYELVLARVKGIVVISNKQKVVLKGYINSSRHLDKGDTKLSETEYNLYRVLRPLRSIDRESYDVIMEVL